MSNPIRVWHLLFGRPKVTPPPPEGTITFAKLENIVANVTQFSGLHLYKNSVKPGFSVHHNALYTNSQFKDLKEFFDRFDEDGSLKAEEKK